MSTARQRSGLRGLGKLRRTLRRINEQADNKIKPVVTEVAQAIHADMAVMVPKGTGNLSTLLGYRISRDGLTARIGLVTPRTQRDGFYARFIEYGTKGYAPRNIPPQPARPFMQPAFDMNKDWGVQRIQAAISETLVEAARASGPASDG